MKSKGLWEEINASPLLQLPAEERSRMQEQQTRQWETFLNRCYVASAVQPEQKENERMPDFDPEAFYTAFRRAFVAWNPEKAGDRTFEKYLSAAFSHQNARAQIEDKESVTPYGRDTERKFKDALEYMTDLAYQAADILHDPELAKEVAGHAGLGVETLRERLKIKEDVLSLDAVNEEDSSMMDCLGQLDKGLEQAGGGMENLLPCLRKQLRWGTLKDKEDYAKKYGLMWSVSLLGFLRNDDKLLPERPDDGYGRMTPEEADRVSRLDHCEDLRPLEEENCLWNVVLRRSYVDKTICPPHAENTPQELEHAALNALLDPAMLPGQDMTAAKLEGVTKSAISQQRAKWKSEVWRIYAEACPQVRGPLIRLLKDKADGKNWAAKELAKLTDTYEWAARLAEKEVG